ncbi:hypothetical protein VKT23_020423 [Stygiomarasmius scandens]|uniref:Uncharacterized protein n=1 Tax=Marasmiellus scandens TaxID=2682957 RepID=A0ABR1ILL1_9AGAR
MPLDPETLPLRVRTLLERLQALRAQGHGDELAAVMRSMSDLMAMLAIATDGYDPGCRCSHEHVAGSTLDANVLQGSTLDDDSLTSTTSNSPESQEVTSQTSETESDISSLFFTLVLNDDSSVTHLGPSAPAAVSTPSASASAPTESDSPTPATSTSVAPSNSSIHHAPASVPLTNSMPSVLASAGSVPALVSLAAMPAPAPAVTALPQQPAYTGLQPAPADAVALSQQQALGVVTGTASLDVLLVLYRGADNIPPILPTPAQETLDEPCWLVTKGRGYGLYFDWLDASPRVSGVSHALHRRCKNVVAGYSAYYRARDNGQLANLP